MSWIGNGDAACDTCGRIYPAPADLYRGVAIQRLRAAGWHYGSGETYGGEPYEALLCPHCARDEKRRRRESKEIDQEGLPLDWDAYRRTENGPGYQSR